MSGDFPNEPALEFMQHLWALNHAVERTSLRMERELGVTAQQRLVLRCLGKYPGMMPTQLAALLHLDRGTISVTLRRLGRRGLVTRRPDPRDSRRVFLGLTKKARALVQPCPGTVESAVEEVLATLGGSSLDATKLVLNHITEALDLARTRAPNTDSDGER